MSWEILIHTDLLIWLLAASCALLVLKAEMRRRPSATARLWHTPLLTLLDIASSATALGVGVATLLAVTSALPLAEAAALGEAFAWLAISYYLWREGTRTLQFQRPNGIAFGQLLVLAGAAHFVFPFAQHAGTSTLLQLSSGQIAAALSIVCGGGLLFWIVPRFLKSKEEHRIVEQIDQHGESILAEYHPATPECPYPERWRMFDSMAAELEVLDFLESLITTVKPQLVVETGTFTGLSTLRMAAGMQRNGFGKIISCELDPAVFARAKQRIEGSGLGHWIELRNESSLDMKIDGMIDIFFSDSHIPIREQEVRRFLPQVSPFGLILMHDASSHSKVVREAALRLEQEGLLSVVLFATPRGLVVAQKQKGRI
ncbi:MAG: O-methyltransferase [Bryobacteraceae bacterium]